MSRRPAGSKLGNPGIDEVSDSMFDPTPDKAPRIPRDLKKPIRKRVMSILKHNPYLTEAQMPSVIRLAELQERFHELGESIDRDGSTVFDEEKGHDVPNPVLTIQMKVQAAILSQERGLAISIPTRKEQIDKRELKPRKKSETKPKAAKGAPSLRIA